MTLVKKALVALLFITTNLSLGGEVAHADPLCYFDRPDGTRLDLSALCGRGSAPAAPASDMTTVSPGVTNSNPGNIFQSSITQIRRAPRDERGRSKETYGWYLSGVVQANLSEMVTSITIYLETFQLAEGNLRKTGSFSELLTGNKTVGLGQSATFEFGFNSDTEVDVIKIVRITGYRQTNDGRTFALDELKLHNCYPERYCNRSVVGGN